METEVRVKKFGGSFGIILPREIIDRERIGVDDKLKIKVEKIIKIKKNKIKIFLFIFNFINLFLFNLFFHVIQ